MKAIVDSMPEGEAFLKKANDLSKTVILTTGKEGQDAIGHDVKQLKIDWENVQHLLKETQKMISKCGQAWSDFVETSEKMKLWEDDFEKRLNVEIKVKKMTPERLEKCRVSKSLFKFLLIFAIHMYICTYIYYFSELYMFPLF